MNEEVKKQLENAKTEEVQEILEKAGVELTDDKLEKVAGGTKIIGPKN